MNSRILLLPLLLLGLFTLTSFGATNTLIINQNSTAILIDAGATGGTAPYTYQWFACNPSCGGTFTLVAGATNTTYYFVTNALTQSGTWQFLLQSTDSASAVANSISTNVVIAPGGGGASYTFNSLSGLSNVNNVISIITDQNTIKTNSNTVWGANQLYAISSSSNSISSGTALILQEQGLAKYSTGAIAIFMIAMVLFIFLLLSTMGMIRIFGNNFIGGISNFTLAFITVIAFIFSGFYRGTISIPSHTITNPGNIVSTVNAISLTTIPLAANPIADVIIISFSIMAGVIGGLGVYLFMFDLRNAGKEKKRKQYDGRDK